MGTIFLNPYPEIDIIKKNVNIEIFELTKENRYLLPNEIVEKVEKLLKAIK